MLSAHGRTRSLGDFQQKSSRPLARDPHEIEERGYRALSMNMLLTDLALILALRRGTPLRYSRTGHRQLGRSVGLYTMVMVTPASPSRSSRRV